MRAACLVAIALALAPGAAVSSQPPAGGEVLAELRIHGNVVTPDSEIERLAELRIGMPLEADAAPAVAARLKAARRFQSVEVLKRYASIADPTQIVLVIVVDEGPVIVERSRGASSAVRVVKTRRPFIMFLPLIDAEDGYGLSYGVQLARPNPLGARSRLSFPLTWGGDKRAAVRLDKELEGGVLHVEGGGSISRRTHPFFEEDDDRRRVWAGVEREVMPRVRAGMVSAWERVSLLGVRDSFGQLGVNVVLDTRIDPQAARNAVYGRAAWDRFGVRGRSAANRLQLDGRGYVGLIGQTVLVVRALREDSDKPLPLSLRPMLGGMSNLRGFGAGTEVGDTLVAGSTELRVPLTSPLSVGKLGVSAFADLGTIYGKDERLRDQRIELGIGGAVWFSAAFVRMNLAVARGIGATTRVHFGTSVTF